MNRPKKSRKHPRAFGRPARAGQNSSQAEKLQISLKRRVFSPGFLVWGGVFLGALVIVLLAILWFYKIYADPRHVFWAMVKNNLATSSVTKESMRVSGSSSDQEYIQISFNPNLRVRDVQNIHNGSGAYTSKLSLETIATADDDYQRYAHIERPQSPRSQADYSKIYGLWLKNGGQPGASGRMVSNTLFGAALFGNFKPSDRDRLMKELQPVYKVDFGGVDAQRGSHRRTYVYHVLVPLQKYAVAAHDYAEILGLPMAEQINPGNYGPKDQLSINMTVDVLSRQLKKIEYVNQGFEETYSGQGNLLKIDVPTKTVSAESFNKAINSLR